MKKILIDTNFATIPLQFNVDIYSEFPMVMDGKYKLLFPEMCLEELKRLKHGKAALELLKIHGVEFENIKFEKNVDNSILHYAKNENAFIATQDVELKKKALKEGLCVITLRQKKQLQVVS